MGKISSKEDFYSWIDKVEGKTVQNEYRKILSEVNVMCMKYRICPNIFTLTSASALEYYENKLLSHNAFRATHRNIEKYRKAMDMMCRYLKGEAADEITSGLTERQMQIRQVLVQRFKNGYRLNSVIERKRFLEFVKNDTGTPYENDADTVDEMISQMGVVHDGRVYFVENMMSDDGRKQVLTYIRDKFTAGITAIYYKAIFRDLNDVFVNEGINTTEMLREYLKVYSEGRYYVRKDYISTDETIKTDPISEILQYLVQMGEPVSYDRIEEDLPHIPRKIIINTLNNTRLSDKFICCGRELYYHSGIIRIKPDELDDIAAIIESEINERRYVASKELLEILKTRKLSIMEYSDLVGDLGIRNYLREFLSHRFSFIGNIISEICDKVSMTDAFAMFAQTQKSFSNQEAIAFADSLDAKINGYYEPLYMHAVRVSQDEFVSDDLVRFDISETDKAISRFCTGEYISLAMVESFAAFPECGYPWTEYLLESYVTRFSNTYRLVHVTYNTLCAVGGIVKKDSDIEDIETLQICAIADSGCELDADAALDYLYENGYINQRKRGKIEELLIRARERRNNRKGLKK